MIALFCGSRGWTDEDPIGEDLVKLAPETIVIHGGARGADLIADRIARGLGLHVAVMTPLYDFFPPKVAPLHRNLALLRLVPDDVYAYSLGTSGTEDMIAKARMAAVRVHVRSRK